MLNCTDELCHLHHHEHDFIHQLDDNIQHEHQVMSGDDSDDVDVNDIIQNILNGTESELSDLSHVDAPSDSLYMVCGVLIAMLLVAVIIVLLAITISKLRKREEHSVNTNHNNNVIQEQAEHPVVVPQHPPPAHPAPPLEPPPFLWMYSNNNSSHYNLCNSSHDTLVTPSPGEEVNSRKGFRKNLRGKWKRLVKKKPQQEVYTIPAELRPQLKQIYVY